MAYVEEKAYESMVNIFSDLSFADGYYFDGYFAADIMKINKKDYICPCFIGFNSINITIVKINSQLEKESVISLHVSHIKDIKIKKIFLSEDFYLLIQYDDNKSFKIVVPHTLKYIHVQNENTEKFLKRYHLL